MDKTRIPVIVGTGQVTDTTSKPEEGRSPLQLMHDAVKLAAADSGAQDQGAALLRGLDSVTVIRLFADTLPRFASPFGKLANAPWSIAQRVGAANATDLVCPPQGGDSSVVMLARACERIAQGESQAALVVGGEALRTELAAKRAGLQLQWGEDAPTTPNQLTGVKDMYTKAEEKHGMRSAIAMYALIGQALRHAAGQTVDQYREASAKLFARFAAVARDNPLATRRKGYSAEQIAEVNAENPFVGFPYTKLMTASAFVDQSAAFIVVSEARADELGIPQDKRVYLHGEAHAHDTWFVSDRERLDQSPAMRLTSRAALAQAGKTIADVDVFDIYSCFPSVVQIACKELGISPDDKRGLTVTGGLPYFGGPGNNYVTHAIAEMVQRVRAKPGAYGLVMASSWPTSASSPRSRSVCFPPSGRTSPSCARIPTPSSARSTRRPRCASPRHRRVTRPSRPMPCCTARTVPKAACCSGAWLLRASASSRTRPPMRQRSRSWSRSKASGCPAP